MSAMLAMIEQLVPHKPDRRRRDHGNPWNLTPRQQDVVSAMCDIDGSTQVLADHLGLSLGGYEQHAVAIYRRMGVRCRARAAVLWALWREKAQVN